MYSKRSILTIFFASLMFHLSLSASVPYGTFENSEKDSYVITNPVYSGCPGGKPADVIILLDNSKYLTKEQFEVQIQRAEHMVRLFCNYDVEDKHLNNITILSFSESGVDTIAKFNKKTPGGPSYTEELANTLRKLAKNHEYDNTITSRKTSNIRALRYILKLSHRLRKGVAQVAFYFSADHSVNEYDLKRAKRIKKKGIYLYILRLGASGITFDEYEAMVQKPVTDFVFDVKQHSEIDASVKKLLNKEHCNMQVFPGYKEPKPICKARRPVNLYLGVQPNSLVHSDTMSLITFYQELTDELENSNGDMVQSQLVFGDFSYKKHDIAQGYVSIIKETMEVADNNPYKDSQKTLLLFMKSTTILTPEIISEVTKLKNHKVEVYVVLEGKSETDFSMIVSKPPKDHIFNVPHFKKINGNKDTILKSICKGW